MDTRRPLPSARATSLFARTVFRELRRAEYSNAELIGFVNELVDLVTADARGGPLSGVRDPETRLANIDVLLEALEFEMRRAREGTSRVLVVCVELCVPEWIADDVTHALHERFAHHLRHGVRPNDTIGRVQSQYVAILPGATLEAGERVAQRIAKPLLAPRRSDDSTPTGTMIRFRSAVYDAAASARGGSRDGSVIESAEGVLARALAAPAAELVPGVDADRASARPSPARAPTASPGSPVEVVLALGGGAARAAAHIGVLRALRSAGIEVAGVAGTSAGAIVGAMFLSGMHEDAILARFLGFPKTAIYRRMRRLYASYRRTAAAPKVALQYFRDSGLPFLSNLQVAAIDDETFSAFIEYFVGADRDFSALRGSFATTATDLVEGRAVTLAAGPLHAALRASCAVPGLFKPQSLEKRLLVDGSTISEVPVKAALAMGKSVPVLAVYLARPEQKVGLFSSSAEVVTRANALVHRELVRQQLRNAPELVTAAVDEIGWLDFRSAAATVEIGFEAMRSHLARRRST